MAHKSHIIHHNIKLWGCSKRNNIHCRPPFLSSVPVNQIFPIVPSIASPETPPPPPAASHRRTKQAYPTIIQKVIHIKIIKRIKR